MAIWAGRTARHLRLMSERHHRRSLHREELL
jgi:hypothetical protein